MPTVQANTVQANTVQANTVQANTVQANGIEVYYEVTGSGEPMVLIPYLAADQACYAFQVAEYAKHYTCYTVDLRGAGLSGKPDSAYTTELLADDVAAFMQAADVGQAHVFGLSLGAFGRHDMATSTRFADPIMAAIPSCELHIFEGCSHAPIYENVADFNQRTLAFFQRHCG